MTPSKDSILGALPDYRDEWALIHSDQSVGDIMHEVCEAHKEFAPYYDQIAGKFIDEDAEAVANKLYRFCKSNIHYREETEDEQSTSAPQGILTRGEGDCKHYAGMIAGVVDAMNRQGLTDIPWCYRFASYRLGSTTPHHVFAVLFDKDGSEIWVDPTPGSDGKLPIYQQDRFVKTFPMTTKKIAGFEDESFDEVEIDFEEPGFYEDTERGESIGDLSNTFNQWTGGLTQAGTQAASGNIPGAIITQVSNIFKLFSNIFGGGSSLNAYQKIPLMFPIGSDFLKKDVADTIAAMDRHFGPNPGSGDWPNAYQQYRQQLVSKLNSL